MFFLLIGGQTSILWISIYLPFIHPATGSLTECGMPSFQHLPRLFVTIILLLKCVVL